MDDLALFGDEDITILIEHTGVDRKKAEQTLIKTKGNITKAIMMLNSKLET